MTILVTQESETIDHLLHINPPNGELPYASWWLRSRKRVPKRLRPGFDTLLILVAWRIWNERNNRVFKFQALQPVALSQEIINEAYLWSHGDFGKKEKKKYMSFKPYNQSHWLRR
ncbi:hypothetical protein EJB05_15971, partial [Eragrostis curvula]